MLLLLKLLNDPSYTRNVQRLSVILRDRPDTAPQRVSTMIDHVIKHGDQHLRTGAYNLSIAEFFMFDIFAVLLAAALVVLVIMILAICCVCRVFCGRCCNKRKKSKMA